MESDDQFFQDLCELIEEHEEERDDVGRGDLLFATREFAEEWIDTLAVTGTTW